MTPMCTHPVSDEHLQQVEKFASHHQTFSEQEAAGKQAHATQVLDLLLHQAAEKLKATKP